MKNELTQIPRRIRELREILDIPPEQIAQRLGIDPLEYQQLETGEKDIPISMLYEIASILGTDFTVLMTGDVPRMNTYSVVRRGEGICVDRFAGYHYESLAFNFAGRNMEPLLVTLEEKEGEPALVMHHGQEYNMVLEGTLKVTIGKKVFLLGEGDSIYFNPALPHGQAAVGGRARFLTVINEM